MAKQKKWRDKLGLGVLQSVANLKVWEDWRSQRSKEWRIFFRAIGFGIATRLNRPEGAKTLLYQSRRAALAHCAVHLFPACISVIIIGINWSVLFIGAELTGIENQDGLKLGGLQLAAKIQELFIIASMSTIILDMIRMKLVAGDGVPFGLIGSGWAFSQVSFFWSMEFWGAITNNNFKSSIPCLKQMALPGLLLVGGIFGLMAGPSTAVLMIPRPRDWPVGGGIYWLNGSDAQLWPTYLEDTYMGGYPCNSSNEFLFNPKCPSAGYLPMYQHFHSWWNFPDENRMVFELEDFSMRKLMYGHVAMTPDWDTWAYTTHFPTAMLQDALHNMYRASLIHLKAFYPIFPPYPKYLDLASSTLFEVKTKVPIVRTACLSNANITIPNSTQGGPLMLPFPVQNSRGWYGRVKQSDINGTTNYKFMNVDTVSALQQVLQERQIVSYDGSGVLSITETLPPLLAIPLKLPESDFSELGILLVRTNSDSQVWQTAQCSVDTRWANGSSLIKSQQLDNTLQHHMSNDRVRNAISMELNTRYEAISKTPPNERYPVRISIDPSWFGMLSPVISDADLTGLEIGELTPNKSTVERLIGVTLFRQRGQPPTQELNGGFGDVMEIKGIENVISTAFADGLSRCGSHFLRYGASRFLTAWTDGDWTINTTMARKLVHFGEPDEVFSRPEGFTDENSSRMSMSAIFTGYVMAASDAFDYFSIVLLLLHVVIALCYTGVVFWREKTSEAWDTVPQLVALACTSPAPGGGELVDTCAGIRTLSTMGKVAIVQTCADPGASNAGNESLQLRFRDTNQKTRDAQNIPAGEKDKKVYGNL